MERFRYPRSDAPYEGAEIPNRNASGILVAHRPPAKGGAAPCRGSALARVEPSPASSSEPVPVPASTSASGIVGGIDVVDAPGAGTVQLDHGIHLGKAEHRLPRRHDGDAAGRQFVGLIAVERLPMGEMQGT